MRFIFQRVQPPPNGRRKTDWIRPVRRNGHGSGKGHFKVKELRRLAALAKIPGRQEMSKYDLADALDKHYAANRIMIAWRSRKRRQRAVVAPPQVQPVPELVNNFEEGRPLDPITLEPVEEPVFVFQINPTKHVHYSLKTLLEYLVKGQVFKDPVTGLTLTDGHLREIDQLAHQFNLRAPSLLLLSRSTQPALQRQHQNLVAGLERIAGSYVEQFRQVVQLEPPFNDPARAAQHFNGALHHEFNHSYRQLYNVDPEAASMSMTQWMQFLQGPPSKPNPDPVKFLQPMLRWMESVRRPT